MSNEVAMYYPAIQSLTITILLHEVQFIVMNIFMGHYYFSLP